jgi:hypothetical protein
MKLTPVQIVVGGLVLSATPALAAPQQIEEYCFAQSRSEKLLSRRNQL